MEAEPEDSLPALAIGDLDLALCDEWQHQPVRLPPGIKRQPLTEDIVRIVLPADHEAARRHRRAVPLAELAEERWVTGHAGIAWHDLTRRVCREYGGYEPDIRHRANDATIGLALIAHGLAVALLPDLPFPTAIRASRSGR